ncbi:P1 family peptidase [Symbiobacterium terraclitae]|uniref:P1 family peptidase n=1 Tax=Symbiobacterium terraclitae TaxID=557451 RepID=UPI0035B55C6A
MKARWRLLLLAGILAPAAMGAAGLVLARLATGRVPDLLHVPSRQVLLVGLAAAGASLGLVGLASRLSKRLEEALRQTGTRAGEEALRAAGYPVMLVLVVTSALGEELLFRGGLQPLVGLLPAAFLFGFSHGGWQRENWAYVVVAALSGSIFGAAYALTGDLWAPAIGHSIHNVLSTLLLGRRVEVEWRGRWPVIRLVPEQPEAEEQPAREEVSGLAFPSPYPPRPTARALGLVTGRLPTGPNNDICDVTGVRVGHATRVEGEGPLQPGQGPVRTGVTAVLPHGGNLFQHKVPAGLFVLNGFGKATGLAQVAELGTLETPILLTNTLSAFRAADELVSYMIERNPEIGISTSTINPVVGECNDGYLNDIQGRHVTAEMVRAALDGAAGGPVQQGAVGAGTGMVCFGFKGGVGSASRRVDRYLLGALVLANFGRRADLLIHGVPVGQLLEEEAREAERAARPDEPAARPEEQASAPDAATAPAAQSDELQPEARPSEAGKPPGADEPPPGSVMIILATDAPLDARQLTRLAKRGALGLARTGGSASGGSGDFVLAFSTANRVYHKSNYPLQAATLLRDDSGVMDDLFRAAVEAVEEAVLNALFTAQTVVGRDGHVAPALPVEKVMAWISRPDH